MEQLMGLAASGHTQVFLVQLFDGWIVVGFADIGVAVFAVKDLGPFLTYIHPVGDIGFLKRLPAAVYTATRICHDFNEVEFLSVSDGFHQFPGIAQSMDDGSLQSQVTHL